MEVVIILIIIIVIIFLVLHRKKNTIPNYEITYSIKKFEEPENSMNTEPNTNESDYLDNYWIPVESIKREVKLNLHITYKNTRSVISERQFDLTSFSRGEKGYHIHGFCHRKNRNITLSSLGIISVKDISTGEDISNIIDYIENAYKNTINYKQDLLFDEFGWAIYILIYLSATSGSVVKKERDVIIAFIKSLQGFENISEEWLDKTLKELYRPGKMEIRNWIKEGISKNHNYRKLFPWIDKLESLQKELNKEFYNLKTYIEKQLNDANNIPKV